MRRELLVPSDGKAPFAIWVCVSRGSVRTRGGSNSSLVRSHLQYRFCTARLVINRKYRTNQRIAQRKEHRNGKSWGGERDTHSCSLGGGTRGWFRGHTGSIQGLKALCTMGAILIGKTKEKKITINRYQSAKWKEICEKGRYGAEENEEKPSCGSVV